MDYRAAIAKYLNLDLVQVEAAWVENSEVACLVNYGIGGTKKFSLSLAELTPVAPLVVEKPTVETPLELVVSPVVMSEKPKQKRKR